MKAAKLVNGLLWTLNIVLGGGIVFFAFQYLLFPPESDALADMEWAQPEDFRKRNTKTKLDVSDLRTMINPVEPPVAANPSARKVSLIKGVELKGTIPMSDPKKGAAILEVSAKRLQVMAYMGEKVMDGDDVVSELRGWTLAEVYGNRAVFTDGSKTTTLHVKNEPLEAGLDTSGLRKPGATGKAYKASDYKSRRIRKTANYELWEIDPNEVDYAMANVQAILEQQLQLSAYASGGVKVDGLSGGTIAAMRGVQSGDVIKSLNGVSISDVGQMQNLMRGNKIKSQRKLSISVQRAGRMVTLDYKMGAKRR